ncbi:MAG: amino acid permease [Gammaproteobacteria bacterium RIFCSPHIGHO2_12_FULL_40_19]|nr:MAG: amino acid permease [Gammaproteobacteria bacterium RIFCSPHIGHO2_12_FULL_40_19]
MKRSVTTMTLLFTSVSAILGSGWLFSAFYASTIAGPASILSWLIAGVCIIFVAFVFAELSAMFPVMGSSTRIPQMTHGTLVGFMYSWIIWLCYAAIPPTEVQAIIQYASFYYPSLTHANAALTLDGYMCATVIMLIISALNAFSLRWLLRCNSVFTLMKILIPVFLIVLVFAYYFNPATILHPGHSAFLPLGIKGVLSAISAGGMVYAFNGFTQASELGGAVKNPGKSLPIAIIGSIVLTLIIYLGLQVAFLTSMTPANLIHGWGHITLARANSPLAAIMHQDGFKWFLPILFSGAIIGPFAASLIYTSGAAHSLRSKSINGYLPSFLQALSSQNTPVYAIGINFALGMLLFAPLPGWNKMMGFLTSLMTFTYTIGPICLLALREQAPDQQRPFRLPFATLWATIAFYFCTVFSYFNGWEIISKLSIGFIAGLIVLLFYRLFSRKRQKPTLRWIPSIWIWPYISGLTLISYLGSFGGGRNILPFGWDLLVLAFFSIGIIYLARRFKMPAERTQHYITELKVDHE